MSITVTLEEIKRLRTELAAYPDALVALDEIEACEGDVGGCCDRPGDSGRSGARYERSLD
ncbi:hypothetical protein K9N68_07055 [Kovacikia minuta CCNUW1]|uniref:hypothetical protein n=1 Tax=Kovacikia minuta TaxID=2931930 RepID=UPI001CC9841F|nr:hypothetical protein [Kovacikia minuta]UBF27670.1 hypothetical protein K9N68_07055 [Kovacikia minuta CCNUW1]